jgi:epoxyqueuosine reductase
MDLNHITHETLNQWAQQLGFQKLGISDIDLSRTETFFHQWLFKNYHGDMEWMQRHGTKRTRPEELEPETISIISVRMNYRPPQKHDPLMVLNHPELAYISRYALGRDYHKMMRKRLQKLANRIKETLQEAGEDLQYRVFVDSAPVMEKPIAAKAGLGWRGKHTNILSQDAGSWFFLGEIYTNLPLTPSEPIEDHCGSCEACLDICPTQAIIEPYVLDARRCISYLTIEHKGVIPEEFRQPIGNRIYGCDDCQLVCPWNRFAQDATSPDFAIRHDLDTAQLLSLFVWTEEEFLKKMEGSPIRRMGHERWQRNIAVALGNAPASPIIVNTLKTQYEVATELVREHIHWALKQQMPFGDKNHPPDLKDET